MSTITATTDQSRQAAPTEPRLRIEIEPNGISALARWHTGKLIFDHGYWQTTIITEFGESEEACRAALIESINTLLEDIFVVR